MEDLKRSLKAAWQKVADADGDLGSRLPGTTHFNHFMALRFAVHEYLGASTLLVNRLERRIKELKGDVENLKEEVETRTEQVEGLKAESPYWSGKPYEQA